MIVAIHTQGRLVIIGKQAEHVATYQGGFPYGKLSDDTDFVSEICQAYPLKDCSFKDDNFR